MTTDPASAALARVRAAARSAQSRRQRRVIPPVMTGSGPDERDPQMLGPVLSRWIRGNGYSAELAVAGVSARWPQIVGPQVAAHVTVGTFTPTDRGGELVVQADSQEWAVQLRYLVPQIQRRIDEEIGAGVVTRLEVRGPGRRATGGWRVRTGRRSPRVPAPPPPQEDTLELE